MNHDRYVAALCGSRPKPGTPSWVPLVTLVRAAFSVSSRPAPASPPRDALSFNPGPRSLGKALAVFFVLVTSACEPGAQTLEYEVLRSLPHDNGAYTQGLVFHDGVLFESTGRYGESSIRKTLLETGEVLQMTSLDEEYFGEGLALVGPELIQLTWKSGLALVFDTASLSLQRTMEYEGEGWGLCFDGTSLYMSNGTDRLLRRNPETFQVLEEIQVTRNGFPVWRVNELECVGDHIYANVYQSTDILRIRKETGEVTGQMDGFRLSAAARRAPDAEAVLNGIAYDPETNLFYFTGKLWQSLFEVRLLE